MTKTRAVPFVALVLSLLWSETARAYLVEVTFDDADDGTGPHDGHANVDNLEVPALGRSSRAVELVGDARRTIYGHGYYGRGADFPGGEGSVLVSSIDLTGISNISTLLWVRARDRSSGRLFRVPGTVALGLWNGELVVEIWDARGESTIEPTGVLWPEDGAYHHLGIVLEVGHAGNTDITLLIDFAPTVTLPVTLRPPSDTLVWVGEGFDGTVDELVINNRTPNGDDQWDWSPTYCPEGLVCLEEAIDFIPTGHPRQVPVRFKSTYDPDLCSEGSPCPLLIDISGGGTCADNYAIGTSFASQGFFVVTIDLYCEGSTGFVIHPLETSQIIEVKNHMLESSPLSVLIDGTDYHATGCSHGCYAVTHLMAFEEDYPLRTFGRSCSMDWIFCASEAGALCRATEDYLEELAIDLMGGLGWDSPGAQAHYETQPVSRLTPEVVASREYAASWGLNLEGELCAASGHSTCAEQSQWGITSGSRRIRDIWRNMEPPGSPTGYFVEDHSADCRHCAHPGGVAFACGTCLLRYGRDGMEEACPECLSYESDHIDEGAEAGVCPIEASWYDDPWTTTGGDGDGDSDADGDADVDGGDGDGDSDADGDADVDGEDRDGDSDADEDADVDGGDGDRDSDVDEDADVDGGDGDRDSDADGNGNPDGGEGCQCSMSSSGGVADGVAPLLVLLFARRWRRR